MTVLATQRRSAILAIVNEFGAARVSEPSTGSASRT